MRSMPITAAITISMLLSIPQAFAHDGPESPFMVTSGHASAPYGFVRFCASHSNDCAALNTSYVRAAGSPANLAELDRVNRRVNQAIEPVTDRDQYGIEEFWTIPTNGRGDCEEYVLLKRRMLTKYLGDGNFLDKDGEEFDYYYCVGDLNSSGAGLEATGALFECFSMYGQADLFLKQLGRSVCHGLIEVKGGNKFPQEEETV